MKKTLLIPLFLFSLILQSLAQDSFCVEFYSGFLNPNAVDYPQRRKEALEKAHYLPAIQKEKIHEIVVKNDLVYMSYANSFIDLWRLRYNDKWEPEVLVAVSDTARFYIRHCDTDIELGFSQDVGILYHILQQLRASDGLKAKIAFLKLAGEIKKVRDRSVHLEHIEQTQKKLKENLKFELRENQKINYRKFRKALKKALIRSARIIRNNRWKNKSFV